MKSKAHYFTFLAVVSTAAPATADIIYGSLQQTISTDYTGVTVTVGAGTLNPFFGGVGVANNNALQPFRMTNTGGLATIVNFGTGVTIDSSSGFLATGAGGSTDHVGTTFTDGTEGHVGFKLNDANYGWARVVFTNNTSTPVTPIVKDWAYDNTGAAIKTGWIKTDIVSPTAQTVTLNPGIGDAFTLGSVLADASGSITNSVLKTGSGTTVLSQTNTYTGATNVNVGTLVINGSTSTSSAVTVANGATLGGSGAIGGSVTVQGGGTFAPGSSIESIATGNLALLASATFAQEIDKSVASGISGDLTATTGSLSITSGAILTLTELGTSGAWGVGNTITLIGYSTGTWNGGLFTYLGNTLNDDSTFNFSGIDWTFDYNDLTAGDNYNSDLSAFTGSAKYVTMTAIPEPRAALLGGIGLLMLLRRRR